MYIRAFIPWVDQNYICISIIKNGETKDFIWIIILSIKERNINFNLQWNLTLTSNYANYTYKLHLYLNLYLHF